MQKLANLEPKFKTDTICLNKEHRLRSLRIFNFFSFFLLVFRFVSFFNLDVLCTVCMSL